MGKLWIACIVVALMLVLIVGCGGGGGQVTYKDGEYEGKTEPDDRGAWGQIDLVIEGGKIAEVDFLEYQEGGVPKDEDYQYQKSVDAQPVYEKRLLEKQDPDEVEVVSGATATWKKFKNATKIALEKAKK